MGGDGPRRNLYSLSNLLCEMHLYHVCLSFFPIWLSVIAGIKDKGRMTRKKSRDTDSVHSSYQCSMRIFKHTPGDNSRFFFPVSIFLFCFQTMLIKQLTEKLNILDVLFLDTVELYESTGHSNLASKKWELRTHSSLF